MSRLDAHVHLLAPARFDYPWLGGLPALRQAFGPAELAAAVRGLDVAECVVVQAEARPDQAYDEAAWVTALAAEAAPGAPRIRGVVARAALERGSAARAELDRLAALPLVVGVRRNVQGEAPGFADRAEFVAGVRACADYGFAFDLCVTHDQLAEAVRLARACPEVRVVVDHAGKPPIRAGAFGPWGEQVRALAALPNTWCKLSGLATEADPARWGAAELAPYAAHVLACFGAARTMWGSDWPVVTLAGAYARWAEVADALLAGASEAERARVWRGTAAEVYRIGAPAAPAARPAAAAPSALLRLHPDDNVLVAIAALDAGAVVDGLTVREPVPLGHKVAARAIPRGARVLKWGSPIGSATADVPAGAHVHLHNMRSDYLPTYTLDEGRRYA